MAARRMSSGRVSAGTSPSRRGPVGALGVEALAVGEQHQPGGPHQDRHLGGQHVVVAEGELVGGGGVVLVDDRHGAHLGQAAQGGARVEVRGARGQVAGGEQHLGRHHARGGRRPRSSAGTAPPAPPPRRPAGRAGRSAARACPGAPGRRRWPRWSPAPGGAPGGARAPGRAPAPPAPRGAGCPRRPPGWTSPAWRPGRPRAASPRARRRGASRSSSMPGARDRVHGGVGPVERALGLVGVGGHHQLGGAGGHERSRGRRAARAMRSAAGSGSEASTQCSTRRARSSCSRWESRRGAPSAPRPGRSSDEEEVAVRVHQRARGRLERGVRVGGHGRGRAGEGHQQGALAGVGQAHQGHVHRQPQLQGEPGLLARARPGRWCAAPGWWTT